MNYKNKRLARAIAATSLIVGLGTVTAQATDGYFQHGYGARHKALGGAGVADGRDATAGSLNPAGLVHAGTEVSAAVSWFSPMRDFEGSGQPGFTPSGTVDSFQENFFIPNMAGSYRMAPGSIVDVVGVSVVGNGGMNTNYGAVANPACPPPPFSAGAGVFCGGKTGVDLQQAIASIAVAKQFGPLSVGFAPMLLRQRFKARGLQLFGQPNNDNDVAWGAGMRGGIEWSLMPNVRLGVAGTSKVWSQSFEGYETLFAERGGFDIPASVQAGIAVDLTPQLTAMVDYKRIFYEGVNSIANPSTNAFTAPFGASNGPGFGWQDVDVIKVGLEWRGMPDLTLRAGYSYATAAITGRDVMFNILAPGVVQHHITGGFEYQVDKNWSVELAGMYAPESTVSGTELPPPFGNPGHNIDISMHQFDVTFGVKYKFGE
ncbi:MAG: outer membrane protein transport protein [Hyphomicrobium sp.]